MQRRPAPKKISIFGVLHFCENQFEGLACQSQLSDFPLVLLSLCSAFVESSRLFWKVVPAITAPTAQPLEEFDDHKSNKSHSHVRNDMLLNSFANRANRYRRIRLHAPVSNLSALQRAGLEKAGLLRVRASHVSFEHEGPSEQKTMSETHGGPSSIDGKQTSLPSCEGSDTNSIQLRSTSPERI